MLMLTLLMSFVFTLLVTSSLKAVERDVYLQALSAKGRLCDNCGAPDQGTRCAYCRKVR